MSIGVVVPERLTVALRVGPDVELRVDVDVRVVPAMRSGNMLVCVVVRDGTVVARDCVVRDICGVGVRADTVLDRGVFCVRVPIFPLRGVVMLAVRSRTVVPDFAVLVARDVVVPCIFVPPSGFVLDDVVGAPVARRVAARAMSDASSQTAGYITSGAISAAKSSLIPFILVYYS